MFINLFLNFSQHSTLKTTKIRVLIFGKGNLVFRKLGRNVQTLLDHHTHLKEVDGSVRFISLEMLIYLIDLSSLKPGEVLGYGITFFKLSIWLQYKMNYF